MLNKGLIVIVITILSFSSCSSYNKLQEERKQMKISYDSSRTFFKTIALKMNLNEKDTVCDIAAGWGVSISSLANYLPKNTIYYEEDILKKACKRSQFKAAFKMFHSNANINNFHFSIGTKNFIPHQNEQFKNVVLFISIHEFEEKEKMLKEVERIMRKEGKLYILETVYDSIPVTDPNCKLQYLSKQSLYSTIENAGLKIGFDSIMSDKPQKSYSRFLICAKH